MGKDEDMSRLDWLLGAFTLLWGVTRLPFTERARKRNGATPFYAGISHWPAPYEDDLAV